ncbi:hypothetical protein ACX0G9_07115 [Flavitalea flava]
MKNKENYFTHNLKMEKEEKNSRRKFLKSGIITAATAGAGLVSTNAFSEFINQAEVRKLNPKQKEFMLRYGKWMDDFIDVIRKKQVKPGNREHQKLIMLLSKKAEGFKPELTEFLKDETFALIYQASIDKMSKEIK